MSSASSTASLLACLPKQSEMQQTDHNLLAAARGTLQHQQSLGLLTSIDSGWLEEHRDLLDTFVQNPNDPAVLEQMPPGSPMAVHQATDNASEPMQIQFQEASPGAASQSATEAVLSLPQMSPLVRACQGGSQGQTVTTGYGDGSPIVETPQRQANRTSGLRILHSARSEPAPAPMMSSSSLEQRTATLVPEVSLAARAGSLGAISMQSSHRNAGKSPQAQVSEPLKTSGEDTDEDDEDEESEEPIRKGPGRKKRTAPILVETEDGETKYVSPAEFRKLRRRITNRLSARRMRKKHAEERALIQNTTKSLEDDRNFYKHAYEQTLARLKQEQLQCQQLRADNGELRARWNGMMHRPPPPEADTKQGSFTAQQQFAGFPQASFTQQGNPFEQQQQLHHRSSTSLPTSMAPQLQHAFMGSYSFADFQDAALPSLPDLPYPVDPGRDVAAALGMPQIPGGQGHSLPFLLNPTQSSSQAPASSSQHIFPGRPVMK